MLTWTPIPRSLPSLLPLILTLTSGRRTYADAGRADDALRKFDAASFANVNATAYPRHLDADADCIMLADSSHVVATRLCLLPRGVEVSADVMRNAHAEWEVHVSLLLAEAVQAYADRDAVLLDIGGCFGKHGITVAANTYQKLYRSSMGPDHSTTAESSRLHTPHVWIVEPFEYHMMHIYHSAKLNGLLDRIHLINNAISIRRERSVTLVGPSNHTGAMNIMTSTANELADNPSPLSQKVDAVTLVDVLADIHATMTAVVDAQHRDQPVVVVVKMDIEGMDLPALAASLSAVVEVNRWFIPYVVVESPDVMSPKLATSLARAMRNAGYDQVLTDLVISFSYTAGPWHWFQTTDADAMTNPIHGNIVWKHKSAVDVFENSYAFTRRVKLADDPNFYEYV